MSARACFTVLRQFRYRLIIRDLAPGAYELRVFQPVPGARGWPPRLVLETEIEIPR